MTITVNQFRYDYPEFGSTTNYPASQVAYWLGIAYKLLNADRWGDMLDVAAELYAAHNIVLEYQAQKVATSGGVPGLGAGVINSKSVDKVSVGMDTSTATEADGGSWNLTTYGMRLYKLIRLFGAGPIQIGPGSPAPALSGMAWPGPYTGPGFSNF